MSAESSRPSAGLLFSCVINLPLFVASDEMVLYALLETDVAYQVVVLKRGSWLDWANSAMLNLGYLGVMLAALIENIFPPMPNEAILVFAGFLATRGQFSLEWVVLSATLGSALGALLLYSLGYCLGRKRVYRFLQKFDRWSKLTGEYIPRAEKWFARHGGWAVFFCRTLPVIRGLISIPAGMAGMNLSTFVLYTLAGTLLWNTILVGSGAGFGAAWKLALKWMDWVMAVGIAVVILIGCFLGWRILKKEE